MCAFRDGRGRSRIPFSRCLGIRFGAVCAITAAQAAVGGFFICDRLARVRAAGRPAPCLKSFRAVNSRGMGSCYCSPWAAAAWTVGEVQTVRRVNYSIGLYFPVRVLCGREGRGSRVGLRRADGAASRVVAQGIEGRLCVPCRRAARETGLNCPIQLSMLGCPDRLSGWECPSSHVKPLKSRSGYGVWPGRVCARSRRSAECDSSDRLSVNAELTDPVRSGPMEPDVEYDLVGILKSFGPSKRFGNRARNVRPGGEGVDRDLAVRRGSHLPRVLMATSPKAREA
jgi:hypothetical protein